MSLFKRPGSQHSADKSASSKQMYINLKFISEEHKTEAGSSMKWVTRERAKVDRIACPWLIKNFIDSEAEFIFVPADRVQEIAEKEGAIPFDVPGAELGHHGDKVSFDALIERYGLGKDPALVELASIVRGADTRRYDLAPQAAGLETIAEGFRLTTKDDFENMARQFHVYDALYAYCKWRATRQVKP